MFYRDSKLTKIVLAIFFVAIVAYAYYEARGLLYGPHISISSLASEVHDPYILIKGHADHITSLSIDGGEIQVTEAGAFEEPYLLAPGYNRIVFDARDTYGHTKQQILEIVYTPLTESTSSPGVLSASSTIP